jgi:hypothetical protein
VNGGTKTGRDILLAIPTKDGLGGVTFWHVPAALADAIVTYLNGAAGKYKVPVFAYNVPVPTTQQNTGKL